MQTIPVSQAPPEGGGEPPKAQSGHHQANLGRIANPADGQGQEERSRPAHGDPHQGIDNIPGLYPSPPVLPVLSSVQDKCIRHRRLSQTGVDSARQAPPSAPCRWRDPATPSGLYPSSPRRSCVSSTASAHRMPSSSEGQHRHLHGLPPLAWAEDVAEPL